MKAVPAVSPSKLADPGLYTNRELSWLEFNRRVLEEAMDDRLPVLERLKFLAIFSTNLDEFFMVRVGTLKQQIEAGVVERPPDGMTAEEIVQAIAERAHPMVAEQVQCFKREIMPRLKRRGIEFHKYRGLTAAQRETVDAYFYSSVFPVLTPLAVDPGHPFPQLPNLSLNLAISIEDPARPDDEPEFALVQVPGVIPRLVALKTDEPGHHFLMLGDLITEHAGSLFPGYDVTAVHPFRITRNADLDIAEQEADDLLKTIEQELRKRRHGATVRLEVDVNMPQPMRELLIEALNVEPMDLYEVEQPLNIADFMQLTRLDYPALKLAPFTAYPSPDLRNAHSQFSAIRRSDVLLHHPYESFSSVVELIQGAATDPRVLAIKMTLYRAGTNSPIVAALAEAAERGKQVTALVELKARFDEENNIVWARQLEQSGVHVVYGLIGLKTHCKVCLIVRREADGIKRYVHLGTGNYNPATAAHYTDLGLFTADPEFGADASELFNFLTGYSQQRAWRKLIVSPVNLRAWSLRMIEREIRAHRADCPGRIVVKMNALVDAEIIRALYKASQAGVHVSLLIRGICGLRPGVPGVSDNIEVLSIVGRFLEHSRICYFRNGGDEEVYLGSADWMPRNLDRRVEVIFPVGQERLKRRLIDEILPILLNDNLQTRELLPDGTYRRRQPAKGEKRISAQQVFMALARRRQQQVEKQPFGWHPVEPDAPTLPEPMLASPEEPDEEATDDAPTDANPRLHDDALLEHADPSSI